MTHFGHGYCIMQTTKPNAHVQQQITISPTYRATSNQQEETLKNTAEKRVYEASKHLKTWHTAERMTFTTSMWNNIYFPKYM